MRKSMREIHYSIFAFVFALVLSTSVQAGEMKESGRYVNLKPETSCSKVGDVEGHVVCSFVLDSVSIPDKSEIASRVVRGSIDYTNGIGANHGHTFYTYADGSTRVAAWKGESKKSDQGQYSEGTYECVGGSGRYAGVQCSGKWKSVPQKGGFTLGEYSGKITLQN